MIRSRAGAPSRWKYIAVLPVLIVALVVAAADVRGQAAAPGAPGAPAAGTPPAIGSVPANVKSINSTPALQPHVPAIDAFIKGAVAHLANDQDPTQQTRARNALINEAMINGLPNASATYLDVYAQLLNQALLPLAKHPSPRVRLNAAIVAARIAEIGKNVQLAPTVLAFLNDESDAVVLWAMKGARWIIPAQLRFAGGFNAQLAKAIVPTVAKHTKGQVAGAIALDAYRALTIDIWAPNNPPSAQEITTMAPFVLDLLKQRLNLYVKGVPPAAHSEVYATGFLTSPRTWPLLNQQQQAEAMQAIVNLIGLAGQQAKAANPGDLFELVTTIQNAARGVSTVLPPASAPGLAAAGALVPGRTNGDAVQAAVNPVFQAVKSAPAFAKLSDPPPIQGNEPAPPPATAPTTGNVLIPGTSAEPAGPDVAVPPGTTPARGDKPDAKPGAKPDEKSGTAPRPPGAKPNGDGASTPNAPGGEQSPRPTRPGRGGAAGDPGPTGGTGGAGRDGPAGGAGAGRGGTTPPGPRQ